MAAFPETRASLMVRLKDQGDHEAWSEFTEIYSPVIYRLACRKGLQPTDADDLVQHVLAAVAHAVVRWETDPARAHFRTWLSRVATNAAINALTRRKPDRGSGESNFLELLEKQPAVDDAESQLFRIEHRREVFRWAARQIRPEFQPATWDAFWRTAVEGLKVDRAAADLGLSPGSVYAARSRVMRRLKEKVQEWEGELPT
jgi:RNA polymerase sigma-70 factor (ECF subfamily)